LKKGHWIDHQTRTISVTMQLRNNNAGVRFMTRYMFEITQMGAVLPSYDMETLIDDEDNTASMRTWMLIALILTIWFAMLEVGPATRTSRPHKPPAQAARTSRTHKPRIASARTLARRVSSSFSRAR